MAKRILIVDDDRSNLELARKILRSGGYEVVVAYDGQEAIRQAVGADPDLILMDLSLPGMNGWEATQQIRAVAPRTMPIIAVTAHAMVGDREQAIAAGCTDYLAKPYKPVDLRTKVAEHLPG